MKILILHHCDSWGGAGVSLRDICLMLIGEHKVTVCLPHLDTDVQKKLSEIDGLNFVTINADMGMISAYNGGPRVISRTFARNLLRIKKSKNELEKILKKTEYDLVIHNSITLSWAAIVAKKMKIPNIMYIRESRVNNLGYTLCKYLINKYCDGIAFISEYDQRIMNCKLKKQAVIHDCLDFEKYRNDLSKKEALSEYDLDASKFNVLYVGGDDELKGYSIILSAMQKINNPLIQLVVAGDVPNNKKMLSNNITYVGKVYDMPLLYRACDVLVFPSTKGHQARPVFEAGAMGLPVIISDFPETRGAVENEVNGLTFEPMNSTELVEKIVKLYESRQLCKKLGEENHKRATKNHNFDNVKGVILEFIESANLK